MFWCSHGDSRHQHSTREEARVCWGLMPSSTVPVAGPVRPSPAPDRATDRQVAYVGDLGGDVDRARSMTKRECSTYIDDLKKKGAMPSTSYSDRYKPSKKGEMITPLLEMVPDGYYAVREEEGDPYTFLRVKQRKNRPSAYQKYKFNNCRVVQTKHGPNLSDPKFVIFPNGDVHVYERTIEDTLMLLVVNYQGAARTYARELGRCCRCNAELTDERSRHYGIGPECEQHWPWIIEAVDQEDALKAGRF